MHQHGSRNTPRDEPSGPCHETLARNSARRQADLEIRLLVGLVKAFGIYFVIVGAVFLDAYKVPSSSSKIGNYWPRFRSACSPPSSRQCWSRLPLG